jgi:hypothetical protein
VAADPVPQTVATPEVVPPVEQPKQQEVVDAAEPAVMEPTATDAATDHAVTQSPPPPADDAITSSEVTGAIEAVVPPEPAPTTEPAPAPSAESTVATEAVPTPIAAAQTTPTNPPLASPRPAHPRYLVVPESIALKADASFVKRADALQPAAEATSQSTAPHSDAHSAAEAVRPLQPTTSATTTRSQQPSRTQARAPQGRTPQRQGRQAPPGNNGREADAQPQPRFGTTMFPNLSAGINAVEERLRRDPSEKNQASPTARPVTVR